MKKLIPIFILLFSITNFAKSQYLTKGDASIISALEFQLTPYLYSQIGSVWCQNKLNLNNNFSIWASLNFGINNYGADGMAFVLQPLNSNLGYAGEGMGYGGITPSVGVEFDTFKNYNLGDPYLDHLGINVNGSVNHNSSSNLLGPINLPNIEDGLWHSALFTWSAITKTFIVTFDGIAYSITYDFVTNIFGGNPYTYWGFTAATGGQSNDQRVRIDHVSLNEDSIITPLTSDNFKNTNFSELNIKIFPNPSNGKFSIQLNYMKETNAEINIMDINGVLIHKRIIVLGVKENVFEFDLKTHASGLYFIKVITEDETYIEKAFIQR